MKAVNTRFEEFVRDAEPLLRRAFAGALGPDRTPDAIGEAFAWAWENQRKLFAMSNPVGYVFRVGQSRTRTRKPPQLPPPHETLIPQVEPELIPSLQALTDKQRTAVWLLHACSWSTAEVAEAMGIAETTVATHASRALQSLRAALGEVSR